MDCDPMRLGSNVDPIREYNNPGYAEGVRAGYLWHTEHPGLCPEAIPPLGWYGSPASPEGSWLEGFHDVFSHATGGVPDLLPPHARVPREPTRIERPPPGTMTPTPTRPVEVEETPTSRPAVLEGDEPDDLAAELAASVRAADEARARTAQARAATDDSLVTLAVVGALFLASR